MTTFQSIAERILTLTLTNPRPDVRIPQYETKAPQSNETLR